MSSPTIKRLRAAVALLYPDEITPTAKSIMESILDDTTIRAAWALPRHPWEERLAILLRNQADRIWRLEEITGRITEWLDMTLEGWANDLQQRAKERVGPRGGDE